MEKIIESIQNWPVIFQGALGSALFAAVLFVGQKIFTYFAEVFHAKSKKLRAKQLKEQLIRLRAISAKDYNERAFYASLLWLRASRYVVKALIWITLGLLFDYFIKPLGFVGFVGAIHYLFFALNIVKGISYEGDIPSKIAEIKKEMNELDSKDD